MATKARFAKGQEIIRVVMDYDYTTERYNIKFVKRIVVSCGVKQLRLEGCEGEAISLAMKGEYFHADMESAFAFAKHKADTRTDTNQPVIEE